MRIPNKGIVNPAYATYASAVAGSNTVWQTAYDLANDALWAAQGREMDAMMNGGSYDISADYAAYNTAIANADAQWNATENSAWTSFAATEASGKPLRTEHGTLTNPPSQPLKPRGTPPKLLRGLCTAPQWRVQKRHGILPKRMLRLRMTTPWLRRRRPGQEQRLLPGLYFKHLANRRARGHGTS